MPYVTATCFEPLKGHPWRA